MDHSIARRSEPRLSPIAAGGLGLAALLAVATFAGAASSQGRGNDGRGNQGRGNGPHGNPGWGKPHNWNGGYYRAPPIIYGSPYQQRYYGSPYYEPPRYYAPPLIYGPGLNFNFQIR